MLVTLLLLAAASVPPPPVISTSGDRPLVAWMPEVANCAGGPATAVTMRRPLTAIGWGGMAAATPITLRFRIDADGRPLSIEPTGMAGAPYADDVAPSLAASRFAAGMARSGCEITYRLRMTPLAEAPVEDLISYTISPESGPLPKAGWDRIMPAGSTCVAPPRPQPMVSVLPDFRALPGTAGVRDWTMVAYDIDPSGKPVNVHTLHGTANAALDAAGVKAMRMSRFTAGARTGCRYPYWRTAQPLTAPAMAEGDTLQPAEGSCPGNGGWATRPALVYPEPYRRRGIEGWAIIGFDVAPWGATGNIRVLASEPAADFGRQAMQLIGGARQAPSPTGRTGCVERVRFVMGSEQQVAEGVTVPPVY